MGKRKKFRRFKVGQMGYVPGKRQQMFRAHEKRERTKEKERDVASTTNTDGGGR